MAKTKNRVVIVGGGFGGAKVALELGKDARFDVTLISDRPDFHYYPTLYHTATGGKEAQSTIPLARLFKGVPGVTLLQGKVTRLHRDKKQIATEDGRTYEYDHLILSLGSQPNYFGIQGIADYSYSIMTPEKAKELENHLHEQMLDNHKPDLQYVVVGGGPTGIELAGALPAYLKKVMQSHGIEHRAIHVDLIEAAPALLPRMPKTMAHAVERRLRKLGVKLYLNQVVEGQTADELTVNGRPIRSHTVVWTAGAMNNPFFIANGFKLNDRHKVIVNDYLQAEDEIYVIGDNADTKFSGMAQTALYDALFVANNLKRQASGRLVKRYTPKMPIYVIPVGHNWAAVLWGKRQIFGWLGWMLRLMADLVGYKDYEPWWRAGRQWLTEFEGGKDCPTCERKTK